MCRIPHPIHLRKDLGMMSGPDGMQASYRYQAQAGDDHHAEAVHCKRCSRSDQGNEDRRAGNFHRTFLLLKKHEIYMFDLAHFAVDLSLKLRDGG